MELVTNKTTKPIKVSYSVTWQSVLPLYLDAMQSGNAKRIKLAVEELTRMAQAADGVNNA